MIPGLDEYFPKKEVQPSDLDIIYYLFWDKGISLTEFNELPIPYIVSIMNTFKYIKEKEAKEAKRKK